MAAGVLDTGTFLSSDHISCKGGFQIGRRTFRDWKRGGHGLVNLTKALAESCDVYFYKAGNRMGIKTIGSYARQFGLGQKTGIDLPAERSGLMPTAEWKLRVKGEPWYAGETISVAIGQGFLMATPIQMAQVVASVATGGYLAQPHVVRAIRHRATSMIQEWSVPPPRRIGLSAKTFSDIRKGLTAVVERGTARGMRSSLVSIAGKTGTAQVVGLRSGPKNDTPKELKDHAWFVGYAPIDDPQIAVVVLVEHMGHGGSAAAPLAKELIEAYIRFNSKAEIVPAVDQKPSRNPDQ
jgi:penicillin-binding protein 2